MKTLGKLKLNEEKMLKKEELLSYRGGSGDCPAGLTKFRCQCSGSAGSWRSCYASQSDANSSISLWCASGVGQCLPGW